LGLNFEKPLGVRRKGGCLGIYGGLKKVDACSSREYFDVSVSRYIRRVWINIMYKGFWLARIKRPKGENYGGARRIVCRRNDKRRAYKR
jgi:hypothetical protein